MGVDARAWLNREVTGKDIYDVIVSKFDKNATYNINHDERFECDMGRIEFKYKKEERSLFYTTSEGEEESLYDYEKEPHAYIQLGMWGASEYILTEIIKCFGGYLDVNDCDDEENIYIPKSE